MKKNNHLGTFGFMIIHNFNGKEYLRIISEEVPIKICTAMRVEKKDLNNSIVRISLRFMQIILDTQIIRRNIPKKKLSGATNQSFSVPQSHN